MQPEQNENGLLTAKEAAEYLAVSVNTLYDLVQQGKVTHFRRGRRLFFDRAFLDEYLLRGLVVAEGSSVGEETIARRRKAERAVQTIINRRVRLLGGSSGSAPRTRSGLRASSRR